MGFFSLLMLTKNKMCTQKFQMHSKPFFGCVLIQQKKLLGKIFGFHGDMIFTISKYGFSTLIHCASSQKRDPKPRLRRKMLTFATSTLLS
jgi:hypothetical protein